jgi:hypothetical protein
MRQARSLGSPQGADTDGSARTGCNTRESVVDDVEIRCCRALDRAQHRGTKEKDRPVRRFGEVHVPRLREWGMQSRPVG